MNRGPSFKLLGVPVRVEITFFLTTLFLALDRIDVTARGAFWLFEIFAVVFVSILLHEFGHAFAYMRYGQKPAIVLWGLGGLAYGEYLLPPKKRIVVSLAGPLSELFILGIPAYIIRAGVSPISSPTLYNILSDVIVLNIFWAVINLLPILPLDGGNICDSVLEIYFDEPRNQTARMVSMVTALLVSLYAFTSLHSGFIVIFGIILFVLNLVPYLRVRNGVDMFGRFSLRSMLPNRPGGSDGGGSDNVVSMEKARKKRDRRSPAELLDDGYHALERRDYKAAVRIADQLRSKRLSGDLDNGTTELAAFAWIGEHNPSMAEEVLAASPRKQPSSPLAAVLAIATKQTDQGVSLMVRSMVDDPESPAKIVAVDLFAEFGMTHRLARELVDLPGGAGFEAAVGLESMLHRLHRTQDASTVSDVIMLG